MIAVGEAETTFIVEFPGNNSSPGTLHAVASDGTVRLDVNTGLPSGANTIARGPSGSLFVAGTHSFNTPRVQTVIELDPSTGATISTPYQGPNDFYNGGIAVDGSGTVFLADGGGSGAPRPSTRSPTSGSGLTPTGSATTPT